MRNLADGEYHWVGEYQYPDESYGLVSTLFPYLVTRCYLPSVKNLVKANGPSAATGALRRTVSGKLLGGAVAKGGAWGPEL